MVHSSNFRPSSQPEILVVKKVTRLKVSTRTTLNRNTIPVIQRWVRSQLSKGWTTSTGGVCNKRVIGHYFRSNDGKVKFWNKLYISKTSESIKLFNAYSSYLQKDKIRYLLKAYRDWSVVFKYSAHELEDMNIRHCWCSFDERIHKYANHR